MRLAASCAFVLVATTLGGCVLGGKPEGVLPTGPVPPPPGLSDAAPEPHAKATRTSRRESAPRRTGLDVPDDAETPRRSAPEMAPVMTNGGVGMGMKF